MENFISISLSIMYLAIATFFIASVVFMIMIGKEFLKVIKTSKDLIEKVDKFISKPIGTAKSMLDFLNNIFSFLHKKRRRRED